MILPENGSIIVVDDKHEEAEPLLQSLEKSGFHAIYFDGKQEKLPKKPIPKVRIVFLDLVLGDFSATDKNVVSSTFSVLERLIDKNTNGPFLLVTWTNHPHQAKDVSEKIRTEGYPHLLVVMKKRECQNADGKLSLHKVQTNLKEKLEGRESFELFLMWENLIGRAANNIFSQFFQLANQDDKWNQNMRMIFLKLATGILGQRIQPSKTPEVIENVFYSLNSAFLDELRLETKNVKADKINLSFVKLAKKPQDRMIDGKINSKLILTKKIANVALPGNVYNNSIVPKVSIYDLIDGNKFKKRSDKTAFKKKLRHIVLEVTPICDYVQKKSLRSRLLPGVLWPVDDEDKIKPKADYIYKSAVIEHDGKLFCMVFDHRTFTSVYPSKLKRKKPIFMVQNELLADIQSRIASHVSRLGVVYVEKLKPKKKES